MKDKTVFENYCKAINEFAPCMDDYPYVYDMKNDLYFISEKAVERFNIDDNIFSDVIEAHRKFVYSEDYDLLMSDLQKMVSGVKDQHDIQYRWIDKSGQPIWIHCRGRVVKEKNGDPRYMVGCVNEIGERQQADNISGLWQTKSMQAALNHYEQYPDGFFMRFGLDGFKNIVERFGMEYGDNIIRQVADAIKNCLSEEQRVYRAISDEFLVMDFSGGTEKDMEVLYRKVRKAVDTIIEKNKYEAVFTISAGAISTVEIFEHSYSEVMRLSRFCLSMAKSNGRNQLYIYDEKDYNAFIEKRKLMRALKKAVANNFQGFELYFQPIMFSESGELYAAESLCRFFMDGKMVSPMQFIPLLEETGLIIPVGKWIIDHAVEMCKECQKTYPNFRITINLSYVQIIKSPVTHEIVKTIQKYDVEPSSIIVEMTESGHIESSPSIRRGWEYLRKHNVHIAIDDFGTGYSNFQYINDLCPNVVKIDRGFTLEALTQEYMHTLLANIINMAHSMQLNVCIEGIEKQEELDAIMKLSPDFIQGYYYGKPCDKKTFLSMFAAS